MSEEFYRIRRLPRYDFDEVNAMKTAAYGLKRYLVAHGVAARVKHLAADA